MRAVAISVVLVLVVAVGSSMGGPLCGALVRHAEMDGELGITADQREQLEELFENTEKEIIEADGKMRIKRLEMERLMRSDDPDMREIRRLVNEIGDARSSSMLAGIERDIRMKRILAPDQMDRARGMMMRMGMGRGRRAAAHRDDRGMQGMGCKGHKMHGAEASGMQGMGCKGHKMHGAEASGMQGMGCKGHKMHGAGASGMQGMGCKGHKMQGAGASGMQGMGCKGHKMQGPEKSEPKPEAAESE